DRAQPFDEVGVEAGALDEIRQRIAAAAGREQVLEPGPVGSADGADRRQRELLFLELFDAGQPFEVLPAVQLVATRALRGTQKAFPAVIPDGVDGQARLVGQFVDPPPAVSHRLRALRLTAETLRAYTRSVISPGASSP